MLRKEVMNSEGACEPSEPRDTDFHVDPREQGAGCAGRVQPGSWWGRRPEHPRAAAGPGAGTCAAGGAGTGAGGGHLGRAGWRVWAAGPGWCGPPGPEEDMARDAGGGHAGSQEAEDGS